MESNLVFGQKYTVDQFKELINTNKLIVINNPKTDKLFMVDEVGNVHGAVSKNYKENPVVSQVWIEGQDDNTFYLLHKLSSSENNVEDTL